MADARMPQRFHELAQSLLPEEPPMGPHGGRRLLKNMVVWKVIWYVFLTNCRRKDVPPKMGCCGETARTRLLRREGEEIWDYLHQLLLATLYQQQQLHAETTMIDSTQVRAFGGGEKAGPSPVDRRKKGTKYTLFVDRDGVPLVIRAAAANRSDHLEIPPAVANYPEVKGKRGRPRSHPARLYADAGYDCEATRAVLRWLGVETHIRKRGHAHGSHLEKVRWVVERSISWLIGLRRMRVRYDRLGMMIDGWTTIAAAVACCEILRETVT